jgi:outer membrane lipoprotein-sorting protein
MTLTAAGRISDRTRRRAVWALPLVVVGAVAAGVTLTAGSAAGESPNLPKRTAAQLLVALQGSHATALSGIVKETADLGLPSLPDGRSAASLSWQTFITGSHSAKVWVDGPTKQRVALLGELSEADVVHNGKDLWTYTSDSNTVTHTVLKNRSADHAGGRTGTADKPDARDLTPAALAAKVLKVVSPSTAVSVDSSRMVADRAAYTLVLKPRDARSTVRKVTIAIDAKKFVPLRVQVFGHGSSPALQTGFTKIGFAKPAASTFKFKTPAGATVSTNPFGAHDRHGDHRRSANGKPVTTAKPKYTPLHAAAKPKVLGSGWTSVVEIPAGSGGQAGLLSSLPRELTTAGSNGQRVLHTALVNAVLLPDGRAFVGAVSQSMLEHIAATTPN